MTVLQYKYRKADKQVRLGDRHVHSRFSCDCRTPERDVLDAAVKKGLKEICITDHCDIDMGPDWYLPVEEYVTVWEKLKKEYEDRIDVHIGVEMGLNPEFNDKIDAYLASYPFEVVIGSIHTMQGSDPYYRKDYDCTDREFYRLYFETALERIKNSKGFNVFGHMDYVVRYGYEKGASYEPEAYAGYIDEILKEIISRDIALELNTGGLRKGVDFVHPHAYILGRYKELGGKYLSTGSDAHFADHVGAGLGRAAKVMESFDFDALSIRPLTNSFGDIL